MNTVYASSDRHVHSVLAVLAPGDQVIWYVDGKAFFCTVIEVQADLFVRVRCQCWPNGYSAVVKAYELALVARCCEPIDVS